jgi:uncharacterized membrane protein YdjX (TVP38/TMEM64 family)
MRRYWIFVGAVFVGVLCLWLFADALGMSRVSDPASAMGGGGLWPALIGVGLLIGDSVLPVPSTLIMMANGALYGVVVGSSLSLAGKLGGAVAGFALGRSGRGLMDRLVGERERERAERLLARWGLLAILVSRPLPIVAETVVLLAGASGLRMVPVLLVVLVGSVPEAVACGLAGAVAVSFGGQVLIWLAMVALAGLAWIVLRRGRKPDLSTSPGSSSTRRAVPARHAASAASFRRSSGPRSSS